MSTNEFLAKVESIAAGQGWTENTLLDLALRFLGDSDPHDRERFLDFLAEARDQEIEESYPEDSEPDGGDMDGDAESALASAGFGTDEDYGGCCDNDPDDF